MTHRKSHRDRNAIKAIREREGCGHQAATRILDQERAESSARAAQQMNALPDAYAHTAEVERATRPTKPMDPPPADIITTTRMPRSVSPGHPVIVANEADHPTPTKLSDIIDADGKPINGWRDLSGPPKEAGEGA